MSCNSYLEREIYRQYYIHHIKCTHVFLQTTREIFASKHHHLSLHITIFFILDVANIFLITVIYEDINIDIISYTIVFSCNPQEKYLHQINTCTVLHTSVLYCIKREGWKREKHRYHIIYNRVFLQSPREKFA